MKTEVLINPPCQSFGQRLGPKPYALELQRRLNAATNGHLESAPEWSPVTREEREPYLGNTRTETMIYSPRIDLAVRPFADEYSRASEFDAMLEHHRELVERLLAAHRHNARFFPEFYAPPDFDSLREVNINPRCFMAIEIERANPNMKYLLGSAFQAAAWGKVGVVICWSPARNRSLLGVREMLSLLSANGKNTIHTGNLLIVSKEQMNGVLSEMR